MSKKIDDLRAAATKAREAATAKPDDQELAAAATKAGEAVTEAETAAAAAANAPKTKKVRVLADHPDHAINDTPTLSIADADAAVADGWADDHPSAVKYAEGLKD